MGDRRKKLRRQADRALRQQMPEGAISSVPSGVQYTQSVEWRYHVPPPGILAQYDGVVRNGAERLFRLAEHQVHTRLKIQERDSRTEAFQRVFGSISGFAIGAGAVAGGVFLLHAGHELSGFASMLVALGPVVTALGVKRSVPDEASRSRKPARRVAPQRAENPQQYELLERPEDRD